MDVDLSLSSNRSLCDIYLGFSAPGSIKKRFSFGREEYILKKLFLKIAWFKDKEKIEFICNNILWKNMWLEMGFKKLNLYVNFYCLFEIFNVKNDFFFFWECIVRMSLRRIFFFFNINCVKKMLKYQIKALTSQSTVSKY